MPHWHFQFQMSNLNLLTCHSLSSPTLSTLILTFAASFFKLGDQWPCFSMKFATRTQLNTCCTWYLWEFHFQMFFQRKINFQDSSPDTDTVMHFKMLTGKWTSVHFQVGAVRRHDKTHVAQWHQLRALWVWMRWSTGSTGRCQGVCSLTWCPGPGPTISRGKGAASGGSQGPWGFCSENGDIQKAVLSKCSSGQNWQARGLSVVLSGPEQELTARGQYSVPLVRTEVRGEFVPPVVGTVLTVQVGMSIPSPCMRGHNPGSVLTACGENSQPVIRTHSPWQELTVCGLFPQSVVSTCCRGQCPNLWTARTHSPWAQRMAQGQSSSSAAQTQDELCGHWRPVCFAINLRKLIDELCVLRSVGPVLKQEILEHTDHNLRADSVFTGAAL